MGDYEVLVALFDELDDFHRLARPDGFRPFDGPARTREQIEQWLAGPGSRCWWRRSITVSWGWPYC